MGLAATKLGRQVEDGRGLDGDPRKPSHGLSCEVNQVMRQVGPLKESLRLLVVLRSTPCPDVVEVNGELGGVEQFALAQVLARRDDLEPRLQASQVSLPDR